MNIAIIAVAYNRVKSLKRLLSSLNQANYNENVTLIISIDKSDTDSVECFSDGFKWAHGHKIVDKHTQNLGLRAHMMSLGKWFDKFDAIVILEDDIVVSDNFYYYTKQAVEKYHNCQDIAGISLYNFSINYQTGLHFQPIKDENDVYFMNCAMSWGEVWMRDSWKKFHEWYIEHQNFPIMKHLPLSICSWSNKSWLKYHTRYCIEENKFFVYPYISLTTNFGDAGEHNDGSINTIYQVSMQMGNKTNFNLPNIDSKAIFYDGYFENIELYQKLGYTKDELCIDLQGSNCNRLNKPYWLTNKIADYRIIRSFGLNYRPIDANILKNNQGCQIFLYDTTTKKRNPNKKNNKYFLYNYHLSNIFYFIKNYGYISALKDFFYIAKHKIVNKK